MTEMMSNEQLSCVAPVNTNVQVHEVPGRAEQVEAENCTAVRIRKAV